MECVDIIVTTPPQCSIFAQIFPRDLLPPNYPDAQNPGHLLGRSEVERRRNYIAPLHQQLGERHPLVQLVKQCLDNNPANRPSAEETLQQLLGMEINDPYQHLSKLETITLLGEKDEEIRRKEEQLRQKNEQISHLEAQLGKSFVETRSMRQKNEQISHLEAQLGKSFEEIRSKRQKNEQTSHLEPHAQQLQVTETIKVDFLSLLTLLPSHDRI